MYSKIRPLLESYLNLYNYNWSTTTKLQVTVYATTLYSNITITIDVHKSCPKPTLFNTVNPLHTAMPFNIHSFIHHFKIAYVMYDMSCTTCHVRYVNFQMSHDSVNLVLGSIMPLNLQACYWHFSNRVACTVSVHNFYLDVQARDINISIYVLCILPWNNKYVNIM